LTHLQLAFSLKGSMFTLPDTRWRQVQVTVRTLQRCCTKSELGAVATSQTIKQREALVHNQSDAF